MTPINFKANFLKTVYVPQVITRDITREKEVSIVELDVNDSKDINALKVVADDWDSKATTYSYQIYSDAVKGYKYNDVNKEHYLAITTQNEDYKDLKPDKILGLAVFSDKIDPNNELTWLQVDPDTNTKNSSEGRNYKKIGSTLVNYVKSISDKPIYVQAADDSVNFYKKQGFRHYEFKHPSIMIWEG